MRAGVGIAALATDHEELTAAAGSPNARQPTIALWMLAHPQQRDDVRVQTLLRHMAEAFAQS